MPKTSRDKLNYLDYGYSRFKFIGYDKAQSQGWEILPFSIKTYDSERAYDEWVQFRKRGAVVIDCVLNRNGRKWYFGIPPSDWDGDIRQVAQDAGMISPLGIEPDTFRWVSSNSLAMAA